MVSLQVFECVGRRERKEAALIYTQGAYPASVLKSDQELWGEGVVVMEMEMDRETMNERNRVFRKIILLTFMFLINCIFFFFFLM